MAPFREDEIMTIKRLEYALKHSDYRLLRDGAYKLHERYHSHYHFEYIDLLEVILSEAQENQAIPPEIKEILVSTINDILKDEKEEGIQNRVSELTSLSYNTSSHHQQTFDTPAEPLFEEAQNAYQETKEESYIKPFQEFTPIQPIEMVQSYKKDESTENIAESFNVQPTEDLVTDTPIIQQQNIFENIEHIENTENTEKIEYGEDVENAETDIQNKTEEIPQYFHSEDDEKQQNKELFEENDTIQNIEEDNLIKVNEDEIEPPQEETEEEVEEELKMNEYQPEIPQENYCPAEDDIKEEDVQATKDIESEDKQKTIAIFYSQNSSNEKISNILKYRELLYNKKDFSLAEITSLINEIKMQTDTNIPELQIFLDKLKPSNHKVDIITNTQSVNLINLLVQSDITYSIFNPNTDKRINLLPLLGLSNLYKCTECESEYLDTNDKINSFILQCPKCKGAMLPELYTVKGEINMDYYNASIVTLANADTWLLIRPSLSEKLTFDMIKSAIKVSSKVKEVYILDKDINTKETYRRIFEELKPEVKVSANINTMEEFLNNI